MRLDWDCGYVVNVFFFWLKLKAKLDDVRVILVDVCCLL